MNKRTAKLVAALVMICGGLIPLWAADGGFLQIAGIEGSAREPEYKGWIALDSFSFDVKLDSKDVLNTLRAPKIPAPGGGGKLIVTKPIDEKLPLLAEYCKHGQKVREVKLSAPRNSLAFPFMDREARDAFPPFVVVQLKDVEIADCAHIEGAEGEVVHLYYQDLQWIKGQPMLPPQRGAPGGNGQAIAQSGAAQEAAPAASAH